MKMLTRMNTSLSRVIFNVSFYRNVGSIRHRSYPHFFFSSNTKSDLYKSQWEKYFSGSVYKL